MIVRAITMNLCIICRLFSSLLDLDNTRIAKTEEFHGFRTFSRKKLNPNPFSLKKIEPKSIFLKKIESESIFRIFFKRTLEKDKKFFFVTIRNCTRAVTGFSKHYINDSI